MNKGINTSRPLVMHIDLNSCFATVEQQAHVTLRGRPVAVANRRTDHTMLVTASYEAKSKGVKLGMYINEARRLCPDLVVLESDTPKYRHVYHKLMRIMNDYSAHVRMKSIDEGVIDFSSSPTALSQRNLMEIGREIKQRIRNEIGDSIKCNIGIGTNRFLAKTAANLHKPDGMDQITHDNLRDIYSELELTDLTGIAGHFEHRLNSVGIFTPIDFLDSPVEVLERMVFKSKVGRQWYERLRGWEVDKIDLPVRSAGRQYVLDDYKLPRSEVLQRLHNLCEEVGAKIRNKGLVARGVFVYAKDYDGLKWKARYMASLPFFSDSTIYDIVSKLFKEAPAEVKEIGVTCYRLEYDTEFQIGLFGDSSVQSHKLTQAIDDINNRFGRKTISSADVLPTTDIIKSKIPFGSTEYL